MLHPTTSQILTCRRLRPAATHAHRGAPGRGIGAGSLPRGSCGGTRPDPRDPIG
jgi:hypothetical protein